MYCFFFFLREVQRFREATVSVVLNVAESRKLLSDLGDNSHPQKQKLKVEIATDILAEIEKQLQNNINDFQVGDLFDRARDEQKKDDLCDDGNAELLVKSNRYYFKKKGVFF